MCSADADHIYLSFYRPKDGKADLDPHDYAIRNSSYSFHARVHGDLSVSIRLAFPYECGAAYGGRQQQIDTLLIRQTRQFLVRSAREGL